MNINYSHINHFYINVTDCIAVSAEIPKIESIKM